MTKQPWIHSTPPHTYFNLPSGTGHVSQTWWSVPRIIGIPPNLSPPYQYLLQSYLKLLQLNLLLLSHNVHPRFLNRSNWLLILPHSWILKLQNPLSSYFKPLRYLAKCKLQFSRRFIGKFVAVKLGKCSPLNFGRKLHLKGEWWSCQASTEKRFCQFGAFSFILFFSSF